MATLFAVSGTILRANGSCLLQFQGSPNSVVDWVIVSGSGAVAPLNASGLPSGVGITDAYGNAWALYQPGGYVGQTVIGVNYVS